VRIGDRVREQDPDRPVFVTEGEIVERGTDLRGRPVARVRWNSGLVCRIKLCDVDYSGARFVLLRRN
jgi:hypothetical protein